MRAIRTSVLSSLGSQASIQCHTHPAASRAADAASRTMGTALHRAPVLQAATAVGVPPKPDMVLAHTSHSETTFTLGVGVVRIT